MSLSSCALTLTSPHLSIDFNCLPICLQLCGIPLQNGFAALQSACKEGHYQVAELLLQAGASVELETKVRWDVGQDIVFVILNSAHIYHKVSFPLCIVL